MERGSRLAIDVGTVRIGLAVSDPDSIVSTPLPALVRSKLLVESLQEILSLISENGVIEVYVGDPLSLSGVETASTQDARQFALQLAELTSVPVRLVDERLTTVTASAKLRLRCNASKIHRFACGPRQTPRPLEAWPWRSFRPLLG